MGITDRPNRECRKTTPTRRFDGAALNAAFSATSGRSRVHFRTVKVDLSRRVPIARRGDDAALLRPFIDTHATTDHRSKTDLFNGTGHQQSLRRILAEGDRRRWLRRSDAFYRSS